MKDFMCFLHILKHSSLHLSLALKSLKYSLISSCRPEVASLCVAHTQFRFSLQTKVHMYLLRKLFGILHSDEFCILSPFEVLHHLNPLGLHFNCTECFQKMAIDVTELLLS